MPSADLRERDVVLLRDLLKTLIARERLGGDPGVEVDAEVFSFSFQRSDFRGRSPSQASQYFNNTVAPFTGTASLPAALME
jgi:hypothetical protein